jgi:hypothetical protein
MKPEVYQKYHWVWAILLTIALLFVLIWGMSFLFKPKAKKELVQGAGKAEIQGGKAQWRDMVLNNKLVTNTTDYTTERDKVIAELKKIGTTSTPSPNALMDFPKVVGYEQCRMDISRYSFPSDTGKFVKAVAVTIENNQCL